MSSSPISHFYRQLSFEPFWCERDEDVVCIPSGEFRISYKTRAQVRPGAVLRVRPRVPLPENWEEAAVKIPLRAYAIYFERMYLLPVEETSEGCWYEMEGERYLEEYDEEKDTDMETKLFRVLLPSSDDPAKRVELVRVLGEIAEFEDGDDPPWEGWSIEEARHGILQRVHDCDPDPERMEPFYQLVGDVDPNFGSSGHEPKFDWEDIEAIAYIDSLLLSQATS